MTRKQIIKDYKSHFGLQDITFRNLGSGDKAIIEWAEDLVKNLAWYAKPPIIENGKKVIGSYRNENAQLISADPNMLEALIAITENIDKWLETDIPADKETSKKLYDNAKNAIKKAIG